MISGRKPWKCDGAPKGFVTGMPYREISILLTAMQGYASPSLLTFKQATGRSGQGMTDDKRPDDLLTL
jgi:hypothetical protein